MNDRLSFLAYITLYELHDLTEEEEEKRRADRVRRGVEVGWIEDRVK